MLVKIRLFGRLRETAGFREAHLEVPAGSAVADVWLRLTESCPALVPYREYLRFAVNAAYASPDAPVNDGDEVACIPPVSGGEDEGPRIRELSITELPIDEAALVRMGSAVATTADGAVVSFVGRTRETPGTAAPGEEELAREHAGENVLALEYEALEPLALKVLGEIADEIEARFSVRRLAIVHRTGHVELGEASVAIAVASPHREAAFAACRYAIEELKARAPIWKSEQFASGSVWIGAPARIAPLDEAPHGGDAGPHTQSG